MEFVFQKQFAQMDSLRKKVFVSKTLLAQTKDTRSMWKLPTLGAVEVTVDAQEETAEVVLISYLMSLLVKQHQLSWELLRVRLLRSDDKNVN